MRQTFELRFKVGKRTYRLRPEFSSIKTAHEKALTIRNHLEGEGVGVHIYNTTQWRAVKVKDQ